MEKDSLKDVTAMIWVDCERCKKLGVTVKNIHIMRDGYTAIKLECGHTVIVNLGKISYTNNIK